jgi:hypothetical protein
VKGLLNRTVALGRPSSSGQPAAEERAPDASPGARYFREKRSQAQWERDLNLRLREFCQRAAASLGAHAGGFRERRVLAPVAAEADAEAVLNWGFLVSPATLADFLVHLERLNSGEAFPGLMLALTGPWPPYSFLPNLSSGPKA